MARRAPDRRDISFGAGPPARRRASGRTTAVAGDARDCKARRVKREGDAMDITQLILDDHHEQRRLFAILEQIDREDEEKLTAVWSHLAAFLEVHAKAEEDFFYPELLRTGQGAGGKATSEDETEDAIGDHNEIRDAVAAVAGHTVGTNGWYAAVAHANEVNSDHMGEEERQGLTDFRLHASLELRHDLAAAFIAFEASHISGVRAQDVDPKVYIAENK